LSLPHPENIYRTFPVFMFFLCFFMYSFVLVPAVLSVVKKGCILHTKVQNIKLYSYSTLAAAPAAPPSLLRHCCTHPCHHSTAAPTLSTTALLPLPLPLCRTVAFAAPRAAAAAVAAAPHGRLSTWSVVGHHWSSSSSYRRWSLS
jgi:hypothetical protein